MQIDKIIKDFEKMRFINSLEKNISGTKLLYNLSNMNYKKNKYENRLFCYSEKGNERVKLSRQFVQFKFYDDYNVIYCSKAEKIKNKTYTRFFIQGIGARKHKIEFKIQCEVADFYVLDKDKILIKVVDKIIADLQDKEYEYEIQRVNYFENGSGYNYNDICRLYVYDINLKRLKLISLDMENVEFVSVDKKNKNVLYTANEIKDVYTAFNKLYSYDFAKQENTAIYDKQDFEISGAYNCDNEIIVIASNQKEYGINENHKFYKLQKDELILTIDNQYSLDNSVNSDIRYKISGEPKKIQGSIYFLSTRNGKSSIYRFSKGKIGLYCDNIDVVDDFVFLKNELVVCGFDKQYMQELYSIKYKDSVDSIADEKINITDFSQKFDKHRLSYIVDEFEFDSNLDKLTGYVIYPKNYDKNEKYPAVFCIHGGPKTIYSHNFSYEMYLLSQNGYFVFYTNPHGSDGKDNKFADIRGCYGQKDYDDLMKFTDEVLSKYESIDKSKVAVMGGSYGGYMTNHIIGVTDRFKSAITQRSISNWVSFYGVSDIGYYFATDQNNCQFEVDKLWEYSPLKNVDNIKTPTLILHSDEDYRCPLEQGMQLFTRLKVNSVKTKLVIFKGENHDLSRSGKVQSRVSRLEHILRWLEETLKQKCNEI